MAQENIDAFESLKLIKEDKELGYIARQTWSGDGPVTIIKYNA